MSGEIDVTRGFQFDASDEGEEITLEKLNKLVLELAFRIAQGAITERELADGSITASKLAADIAAQLGIPDGSITTVKLAALAVTAAKIAADAVSNDKLANMLATTVKCNPTNIEGDPQDLQATVDESILLRRGGVLIWGGLSVAQQALSLRANSQGELMYRGSDSVNIVAGAYSSLGKVINFALPFADLTYTPMVNLNDLTYPEGYDVFAHKTAVSGMTIFVRRAANTGGLVTVNFDWMVVGKP